MKRSRYSEVLDNPCLTLAIVMETPLIDIINNYSLKNKNPEVLSPGSYYSPLKGLCQLLSNIEHLGCCTGFFHLTVYTQGHNDDIGPGSYILRVFYIQFPLDTHYEI